MSSLTVCLTHDIDRVYKTYQYITHDLKRGNFRNLKSLVTNEEPYWMFNEMAELEEKYGAKSTIFFLHETIPFRPFRPSEWKLSLGRYSIQDKKVANTIREFHANGWEIALHGSYNSYKNPKLLKQEKSILEGVLGEEVIGIRQHYLNHIEPDTWNYQKEVSFLYDASLGRTNGIGYKDDRIKPFQNSESGMFIIPLTLMECYLFNEAGHDRQKALKLAMKWMDHSEENQVPFTILWHQRMFNESEFPGYRWVYEEILKEAVKREAEFYLCKDLIGANSFIDL
ncbi:MAG: polysaccharide deacetylase family protein [Balneolaceae bacterium]|nr:polysaccharide deacetylase family protein [Balneolaceae bacterium]